MQVWANVSARWLAWDAQRGESSIFRHSRADALLLAAALIHAVLLGFALVFIPLSGLKYALLAVGFGFSICWCSNTVSHCHLHRPLFRLATYNRALSLLLTISLAIPQSAWRARHFFHHSGERKAPPPLFTSRNLEEVSYIAALWVTLALARPQIFLFAYLPGYLLGLALCQLQGAMEHRKDAQSSAISHYGARHNLFWFNDGYHVEHHRYPTEHWTRLPARRLASSDPESAFPPLLRPIERIAPVLNALQAWLLGALEQLAFCSAMLQNYLVRSHERAFRQLLSHAELSRVERVTIIGGGLFPRTALVMHRLLPNAKLTIIDLSRDNIERARAHLAKRGANVDVISFRVEPFQENAGDTDLLVAPLAFVGDRTRLAAERARVGIIFHEWWWRRSSCRSVPVSALLLKRLTLLN